MCCNASFAASKANKNAVHSFGVLVSRLFSFPYTREKGK
jgi:hypothetical protein